MTADSSVPAPADLHSSLADATSQVISRISDDHGPIDLHVVTLGPVDGPLVLCVHGWPENWYSWRHQMTHLAAQGYRVAAMDVRGYGGSSRPEPIEAYRVTELAADAAAVIESLSPDAPAVIIGHDWGAPIVYTTARVHPERVRAVVGMSVIYRPAAAGDPMELWEMLYADRFFYMRYFQEPGVAEAAFGADLAVALRKIYFAGSGDSPVEAWTGEQPKEAAMLDFLVDPDPAPEWMGADEMGAIEAAHGSGSIHGWFHRYRAQGFDGADVEPIGEPNLQQPACFIAGADDIVRHFVPGMDLFAAADEAYADPRGVTLVDGIGHWVQQEAPDATNAAIDAFLATVNASA